MLEPPTGSELESDGLMTGSGSLSLSPRVFASGPAAADGLPISVGAIHSDRISGEREHDC